jgi:competence protein ComEC
MIVNASQLQPDKIVGYAQSASLDVTKFKACIDSDKYKAAIDKDIAEGTAAGVTGTPSFVLGRIQNGKIEGVRIVGAMPYAQFDAKIQEFLKQAPTARTDGSIRRRPARGATAPAPAVAFLGGRRSGAARLPAWQRMRLALLAFALGVVALQQQAILPPRSLAACVSIPLLIAFAAAWSARRHVGWRARARKVVVLSAAAIAAGLAGFVFAAWRADVRLADELPPRWEGRDIEVVGVIDELPQPVDRGMRFAFAVERVLTPEAVVPSEVSLAWYGAFSRDGPTDPVPELHAGERWQLTVRLKRPHGTVNPHGFDVEAWLLENNLRATGYVRQDDANRRLDAFAGRPDDYVARERESIRARILGALDGRPYAGVIAALTIGDERAIPAEQWRMFNRTGIGH